MGIDADFEAPKNPDIKIYNDGELKIKDVYDILKEKIEVYKRRKSGEFAGKSGA